MAASFVWIRKVVRAVGFEPTTSWFQARSAARLRYALKVDHPAGLEPATSRSATGCSAPLSYGWIRTAEDGRRRTDEPICPLSSVICPLEWRKAEESNL